MLKSSLPLLIVAILCTGRADAQVNQQVKTTALQLALEVRNEFLDCWNSYRRYAWGHDGLKPLSRSPYDLYGQPLCVSALDAYDTMLLMGLQNQADTTREFVERHLSFDRDISVDIFECTPHLLGGLLTAFQMTGEDKFLNLAEDLGNRLLPAFLSPTGMPYRMVNLRTGAVHGPRCTPAEVGNLLLDFGTLSAITGEAKYYNTAKIALLSVYEARSKIGLLGDTIDVTTGEWVGTSCNAMSSMGAFYAAVVKCSMFFPDDDCVVIWKEGREALEKYLADSTSAGLWFGQADRITGNRTFTRFSSRSSFTIAYSLSGEIRRAAALEESCLGMWTRYGIEPAAFDYARSQAISPAYRLTGDIIEGAYDLYLQSLDPGYLHMGEIFLDSLRTYCRTDNGYAELKSVITKEKADWMGPNFLGGTLKFLYLLFSPPETLEYGKVMFNSVGHPLRKTWQTPSSHQ